MPPWFGDFNSLCYSTCVPLPSCNLLNETRYNAALQRCKPNSAPVRDMGTIVISLLGIVFITRQILWKAHRMFAAVGRTEMGVLFFTYTCILLLQVFTIGGAIPRSRTFMIWTSAFHLGIMVSFFWTLIVNALILFQFVEDGTEHTTQFIVGSSVAWIVGVTFMSLDLAMDYTKHHDGQSPGLYFLTLVFPAAAVLIYMFLVSILVLRKLEEYKSLVYVALALVMFSVSQLIRFDASHTIATRTSGRVNGSLFAIFFDLVSVTLLYKFWNTITDGR
ncbi:unnamed protein product [Mortierella alpina]